MTQVTESTNKSIMQLRDFTPDDYRVLADIRNANFPDEPLSVEDLMHRDAKRDPKCLVRRWIAECDGQPVGFGSYNQSAWSYDPQHFYVTICVLPEFQGRGCGSALYDQMLDALAPFDPIQLETSTLENYPHAMRWLEQRGFKLHVRLQRSILALAEFDPTPWAGLETRLEAEGIVIKSLPELRASDPDWARKHYELDMATMVDIPGFDNFTPPSFEQWQKDLLESPRIKPEAFLAAVQGDQHVGLTELLTSPQTDDLFTGLTAVRREYRRKGIATALKVRALTWAKENGCPRIHTENEENNPMLQLNYALGFRDAPAWMVYRKTDFAATDHASATEPTLNTTESLQ